MRVSSEMTPFLMRTLKSTRMKTRLPRRSRSRIVNFIPAPTLQALFHQQAEQVDAAVRVAPLVVVPREDLDEIAVHYLRVRRVDDRRVRVSFEVDRDELFGREREDA